MNQEELVVAVNKIRLQIKADPDLAEQLAALIEKACVAADLDLPPEFFDGLAIVHTSEMDSDFSVTILPVGSQCGL